MRRCVSAWWAKAHLFFLPQRINTRWIHKCHYDGYNCVSEALFQYLEQFLNYKTLSALYVLFPRPPCFLNQVQTWAQQQGQKIQTSLAALEAEREEVQRLLDWISSAEEALSLRDQEPPAETTEQNQELIEQHTVIFLSVLWATCYTVSLTSLLNAYWGMVGMRLWNTPLAAAHLSDYLQCNLSAVSGHGVYLIFIQKVVCDNLLCELCVCWIHLLCLLAVGCLVFPVWGLPVTDVFWWSPRYSGLIFSLTSRLIAWQLMSKSLGWYLAASGGLENTTTTCFRSS